MTGGPARGTLAAMDREQAIDALPTPYGEVIRLLDRGVSADLVAGRLGVDADAAPTLVAVARGKLAELVALPVETSPGRP